VVLNVVICLLIILGMYRNFMFLASLIDKVYKLLLKCMVIHVIFIPPKGEGGILFYLCPSVLPFVQDIFHTPAPRMGREVYCFTSVHPSIRPRYFSSHFSQ